MSDPVATPVVEREVSPEVEVTPIDSGFIQDNLQLNHLSYVATKGIPFIIDYLGLEEYYGANEEVTAMARELHELLVDDDTNVLVEQTKRELDFLSSEMNLNEKDAGVYRLKKLLTMAQIRDKQRQLEQNKLLVLANIEKEL